MERINANEHILLRLKPMDENVAFLMQTFGIMQYIFYDDRFLTKHIKDKYPERFNENKYVNLREKCIKIENDTEIALNVNEFILFAKIVDFVSKCFIGDPNKKFKEILTSDFMDNDDFEYESLKEFYLKKSTKLFNDFKGCKNRQIIDILNKELNWGLDL